MGGQGPPMGMNPQHMGMNPQMMPNLQMANQMGHQMPPQMMHQMHPGQVRIFFELSCSKIEIFPPIKTPQIYSPVRA